MNLEEFEKKTKEELKGRSIPPSHEHWSRLEAALDQGRRTRLPNYLWITAAAAVALLFLFGKFYFNPDTTLPGLQSPSSEKVVNSSSISNEQKHILKKNTQHPEYENSYASQNKGDTIIIKKSENTDNSSQNLKVSIAETEHIARPRQVFKGIFSQKNKPISLQNAETEVDSLSNLANQDVKKKALSPEEEADILLREALYKEFLTRMEQEKDSAQMVADGEELLQEANLNMEKEEDRAFRRKVKEIIQKSWNKAKSALVEASPYR